ncbi:hypothetical protein CDAR_101291 [Caerostris darwini]|uniref:Uncharacterized protein n=1 Tax=Caerostris darwini TaxID=1538125 RepID=A0AAV4QFX1_9ARAC|nr:hypothetical protein CDAR_101291 [Caerostris darwini]
MSKPSSYILTIVKQFCENLSLPMRRNPHFGLRNYSSLETASRYSSDRGLILVIKLPTINSAGRRVGALELLSDASPTGALLHCDEECEVASQICPGKAFFVYLNNHETVCENLSLPMRRNPHFGLRNYSTLQTASRPSSDRGLILVIKRPRINSEGRRVGASELCSDDFPTGELLHVVADGDDEF